jgi:hypothetical protein
MKYNVLTFDKWLKVMDSNYDDFLKHVWHVVINDLGTETDIYNIAKNYGVPTKECARLLHLIKSKRNHGE